MASEIDSSLTGEVKDRVIKRPVGQLWSYGLVNIIGNMIWFVFGRLQIFYTEVVGLAMGTFAIVNVIYMIFNMLNDPLEGYLADRSPAKFTRKYGKRFPFVLIGQIGGSIAIILPFFVLGDIESNPTMVAVWLCIALCIFDTFMSLVGITGPGLFADKYRDPDQRKLYGVIVIITAIVGMVLALIIHPMILGILTPSVGEQTAWLIAACGMAAISVILTFLMIPGIREDDELKAARAKLDEEQETENFFKILWECIKVKDFNIYILSLFLYGVSTSLVIVALDYWVIYGLGLTIADSMTPMLAFMLMAPIFGPIWFLLSKKMGSKKVNILGMIAFGLSAFFLFFVSDMTGTIIVFAIMGITSSAVGANQAVIGGNIMDELAVKLKIRQEGSVSGVITLFNRLQLVTGPLIFMIVQKSTGWVPQAETQIDSAIFGVKLELSVIPAVLLILGGLAFAFYSITPEKAKENHQKMAELGF